MQHTSWTHEWQSVVFSDEKKWNLDGPDGLHYYWHDLRKEPQFFKKRQQGGGSVMTWAAFGAHGQTQLRIVHGRMNAANYIQMLEAALLPVGETLGGPGWIFQQDNASIHKAKVTMTFFADRGVRLLEWPALSPDLSPIENLWGIVARQVYAGGRQFETCEELADAVQSTWTKIDADTRQSLLRSMHNRCLQVVLQHGGKIPY